MKNKSLGLLGLLCALLVCFKVFTGEKPDKMKKFSPRYAQVDNLKTK
jgi:hypothetical protein